MKVRVSSHIRSISQSLPVTPKDSSLVKLTPSSVSLSSIPRPKKKLGGTLRRSIFENSKNSKEEFTPHEDQIRTLFIYFPTFPTKMMTYLINKYSGNCRKVYDELISKGWESNGNKKYFCDAPASHFAVSYYHGNFSKLNVKKIFEDRVPGSFMTYFKYKYEDDSTFVEYFLSFKSSNGEILEKAVKNHQLTQSIQILLHLQEPIVCEFKDISCIPEI